MAKANSPIPPGFHTLTLHLTIQGGAASYIDFLKRSFNAVEVNRHMGPGGKLMHAEVRIGDSALMFNDDFPEFGLPPVAEGRWPFVLNLYVPDADATFAQATAAGGPVLGRPLWAGEGSVRIHLGHRVPKRGPDPRGIASAPGRNVRRLGGLFPHAT